VTFAAVYGVSAAAPSTASPPGDAACAARLPQSPEADALLVYTLERAAGAFADGEVAALGLGAPAMRSLLRDRVAAHFVLDAPPRRAPALRAWRRG